MHRLIKLLISLTLPLLVGYIGSLITAPSIGSWYLNLNKPSFNPPSWIFGPVWTLLYILMGIALYIVWKEGYSHQLLLPFGVYFFQLLLNLLWSVLFFGMRNLNWAFVDIVGLWVLIIFNIIFFYQKKKLAGILLIPYVIWVSFAAVLNLSIVLLN